MTKQTKAAARQQADSNDALRARLEALRSRLRFPKIGEPHALAEQALEALARGDEAESLRLAWEAERLDGDRKFWAFNEASSEANRLIDQTAQDREKLATIRAALDGSIVPATPAGEPQAAIVPKATFDVTAGTLVFLKGKPIKLGNAERYVLAVLVEKRTASFAELQKANERPDRVLSRMLKKYPRLKRFISLPGGGGKGGYSTTIEPTEANGQK